MTNLLFLRAHSLEEWRELSQTSHTEQMARLLTQAKSYDCYLPAAEHPRDSITYIGMAVANMALAYLLTEDESYLNTMRNWIKVGIGYPSWGLARKPDHDLDAAWLLFGLGLAYAWVGDVMPEDERIALRDKLILQSIRMYDYALATEDRYWGSAYWQNHNWICYGGLAVASAALLKEHTNAQGWLDRAVENFKIVLSVFPEDGSDYEGVVYWRYGFPWLLIPAHLFQEECGVDLHDSDFLRRSFHHRLHLGGPNLVDTANFGDCHDRRSAHSRMILYRLASLYNIGEAQWLANHFEEIGEWEREGKEGMVKPGLLPEAWLDFVWFDPSVAPKPVEALAKTAVFPDMGLLTTRSSWQDDATYLAFKCGTPNGARGWQLGHAIDRKNNWDTIKASHEHPDENSFILMRGADYLSVDPGYSKDKLTRNHSTILVDGRGQYNEGGYNAYDGLDQAWGGRLQNWFTAPGLTYVHGEAAGAYHSDLKLSQYRRQMVLVGDDLVLICDDLQSTTSHEYQWLLQTDTAAEQTSINQFTYQNPGTQMVVTAVAPNPLNHDYREIEITANPTSAKPEWIIRHTQHSLVLSPVDMCQQTRFLVALDMADAGTEPAEVIELPCEGGTAVQITRDGVTRIAAFANGRSRLVIPELLSTDADWVVANPATGEFWAGGMTNLWLNGDLQAMATTPVAIARSTETCVIMSCRENWISLKETAVTLHCNNQPIPVRTDPILDLIRFPIPAGESQLTWAKD
ncbi:MAG: heparinase II/III family protein [Anaerolineae bacterium]|nr:heparinase II/III family protein [Anaerolineae bacterium]